MSLAYHTMILKERMIFLNNYTILHSHSHLSNPSSGTGADSMTKPHEYLDRAVELGMTSFAFSEHGSVLNHISKKQMSEDRGLKYIHANEIYLTKSINYNDKGELKLERDNYHFLLLSKNYEGFKELNELTSKSFNREDGHFHYNPRVTFDELKNTSDNIIMTSACLASPIWRLYKSAYKFEGGKNIIIDKYLHKEYEDLMNFFVANKHRMYFEIQYHMHEEQIRFNRMLFELSKETGVPLIAGTDTHSLNAEHAKGRNILLKAKGVSYGDEDKFDLTMKSYDELVEMFEQQGSIPRSAYMEAIHNTNVVADMIETYDYDKSPKYPKLYDEPVKLFKEKINEGFLKRGLHKLAPEDKQVYFDRIQEEFETYEKLDAIDYMLLQINIIEWANKQGIYHGYGRGSVNGSLIAYLTGVTEMDSIKHKLNFFRRFAEVKSF